MAHWCRQYLADLGKNRFYVFKFTVVELMSLAIAYIQARTFFLSFFYGKISSVADSETEPVERQLFAGAGAQVFWPGSGSGYVNFSK
jgi:hypothetical protein